MTDAAPPAVRPEGRDAARWGIVAAAGIGAFLFAWFLGRELFVLAEARGFSLYRPPIDPIRFLLLPELGWGNGRLLGVLFYQATGSVCGVGAGCFDVVGALLVAVAVVLQVPLTARLTGSLRAALLTAALWLTSPTLVGIGLWQGTWFDPLAFSLFVGTLLAWWLALGRERISRLGAIGFAVGSVALLVLAFNAKETTYALLVVLPVVALVRGAGWPGGMRRNLLLAALPLVYGAWFVGWGFAHIDAAYAAKEFHLGVLEGLPGMLRAGLGLDPSFMYVVQQGSTISTLRDLAGWLYLAAAALVVVLLLAGAWRGLRVRRAGDDGADDAATGRPGSPATRLLLGWGAELTLATVLVATTVFLAPGKVPTAYYLSIPVWAAVALLLALIRRAAWSFAQGRLVAGLALAAWLAAHVVILAGLLLPGSTWEQLVTASGRIREVGATLRSLLADREGGPFVWRTVGVPPTSFFVLRDPGQSPASADEAYPAGGDLLPFLLGDQAARRRFSSLQRVTLDELRAGGVPGTADERTTTVVIDADYRLLLVLYEGEVLLDAAEAQGSSSTLIAWRPSKTR